MYDITVITPSLNSEKYIKQCIFSIREQSNVSVQHIVIDGGSIDNTVLISKELGVDLYVVPNTNIYEALNIGVEKSDSKLICFLNSDDYYPDSTTLSTVVSRMSENTNVCVLYGNCRFVDDSGQLLYVQKPLSKVTYEKSIRSLFSISHPSTFFRKSVFYKYGYYNESITFASDCEYIIRLLKNSAEFMYIDCALSNFRRHDSNLSDRPSSRNDWAKISDIYGVQYSPYKHYVFYLWYNKKNIKYILYLIRKKINKLFHV
jgi:glycosyltransferase involved in cell wall biosynthesis